MKFFSWLGNLFKKGKISVWKATDKELNEDMTGKPRVGSCEEQRGDGNTYKGLKITFPLPEGKIK